MIDTIALMFEQNEFTILDHSVFHPSTERLFKPPFYNLGKCVQNGTKEELKQGIYKPKLTITKFYREKQFKIFLKVEFSAPKLLLANNFNELDDSDLKILANKLHSILVTMNVVITTEQILKAEVTAIHYSKNIALTDYSTCSMILNELAKTNLNNKLDLSSTVFRNGGQCLHYHSNNFQLVFYDKLKDLEQSKKSDSRAIEKDNILQLPLLAELEERKPFEVLRIELRLGNKKQIKSHLTRAKLYSNQPITLENLFKKEISKTLLVGYWKQIKQEISLALMSFDKVEDNLEVILRSNKVSLVNALSSASALYLIKQLGVKQFRNITRTNNERAYKWYKLKKNLENLIIPNGQLYQPLFTVTKELELFSSFRISP